MAIWSLAKDVEVYKAIMRAPSMVSRRHMPTRTYHVRWKYLFVASKGSFTCEQDRKHEDKPETCAFRPLNRCDAEESYLGRRIETKTKHHTQRIHLPRSSTPALAFRELAIRLEKQRLPINELEHLLEQIKQATRPFDLEFLLLARRRSNQLLHLLHELVENVEIHKPEQDEKPSRDRRPNNPPDSAKSAEPGADGRCRRRNDYRGDDDYPTRSDMEPNQRQLILTQRKKPQALAPSNTTKQKRTFNLRGMPQREIRPHGDGPLPRGYEPTGHQVNRRDVIGVQGMAKPQGVSKHGRRGESTVVMQHQPHGPPSDGIGGGQADDDAYGR